MSEKLKPDRPPRSEHTAIERGGGGAEFVAFAGLVVCAVGGALLGVSLILGVWP